MRGKREGGQGRKKEKRLSEISVKLEKRDTVKRELTTSRRDEAKDGGVGARCKGYKSLGAGN